MKVLAIDTSNQALAIAVVEGEELLASFTSNINKDHSSQLMPAITNMLEKIGLIPADLAAIVVAAGPGSYTGTRIGVTSAKTLAWSLEIPIIPVSSLEVLAYNGLFFDGLICPFFDARRKTAFTGLYRFSEGKLIVVEAARNELMADWLEKMTQMNEKILFLSPHMDVFKEDILGAMGEQAIIQAGSHHLPNAAHAVLLSKQYEAVDAHLVVPDYLRITEAEANWLKQQEGVKQDG